MPHAISWWVGFNLFVLVMLALDLGLFHRRSREATFRESLAWVGFWIFLALTFAFGLWIGWFGEYAPEMRGRATLEFVTGYLIEQSLSIDNVFVFVALFKYFAVPPEFHRRVLFYGILGAMIFRGIFIGTGLWLIQQFQPTLYLLGALLIFTGYKLGRSKDDAPDPDLNPLVRLSKRYLPMTDGYEGGRFFSRVGGHLHATPLLIVLLVVETTDVLFAADSIPAVLAITTDSFIVYTSNVFAILGLRSLYFVVAGFMKEFAYLKYGLSIVLMFVGVKMLVSVGLGFHLHPLLSLGVIVTTIAAAVVTSILYPPAEESTKALEDGASSQEQFAGAGARNGSHQAE